MAYEDHRYRLFYAKSITAAEGREKCRQDGGRLVSINNPEELEFIELNVLQKRTLSAFIGGSDEEEGKSAFVKPAVLVTHLKLWVATATHNFKWVTSAQFCLPWEQTFANLDF